MKKESRFGPYLVVIIFALVYGYVRISSTLSASHFFHSRDRVDPATLHLKGEFVEGNLGAVPDANGSITLRIIAEKYVFVPACVKVPMGAPIRLRITSADRPHGFQIGGVKIKVVPGIVTQRLVQFPSAMEYQFNCDEFCGPGHPAMMGRIVATQQDEYQSLKSVPGTTCAPR